MWNLPEDRLVKSNWLEFEPEQIIDEFDGPRLFTIIGPKSELFLAYLCSEHNKIMRFLVTSTTQARVNDLQFGNNDILGTISSGRLFVFDVGYDWLPIRCWRVRQADIPSNVVPKHGVMLRRHMPSIVKLQSVEPASTTERYNFDLRLPNPSGSGIKPSLVNA